MCGLTLGYLLFIHQKRSVLEQINRLPAILIQTVTNQAQGLTDHQRGTGPARAQPLSRLGAG
jgi:hypothetical protein